jgi:hypothetical protein
LNLNFSNYQIKKEFQISDIRKDQFKEPIHSFRESIRRKEELF